MNNQSYEITVDTRKAHSYSTMEYSQNNLNISELIINITEDGKEFPLNDTDKIIIYFEKPDRTFVFQDKKIQLLDKVKGKIKVLLTTQTLVKAGDVFGEISIERIVNGIKKRTSTYSFSFRVRSSLASNEVIESTNEFGLIQKAIEAGEQLKDIDIQALIASKTAAEAANEKADGNTIQIGDLQKSLSKQDVKMQHLQHGPNVVNATVASPLHVEVQGRTLANLLGQTTLDPAKYYLFMPNKGTTKITSGGSSYDGVAKFTGLSAISYTIKQDYRGKVAGSIVENGHIARRTWSHSTLTTLAKPTETSSSIGEVEQQRYADYISLDGKHSPTSVNFNDGIAQEMHSFDVIRALQDKFGIQIWQGKTALADKITIAKQLIVDYAAVLYAKGSGPQGNKLYVKRWIPSTSTWFGSTTTTESNPTKVQTGSTNVQEIDSNGFIHVIAYADASDGTRPSVIHVDYAMLELKTKMDNENPMLGDALYEVDQTTYNKVNVDPEFSGEKLFDKFPYVEGIQHLNPVVIVEGINLIPPFIEGTLHPNAKVIGPYELELNPTMPFQASSMKIPCLPNQKYTFSSDATQTGTYFVKEMDASGSQIRQIFSGENEQFLTGPNAKFIKIEMSNRTVEKCTFIKPMLVLGDAPPQFVPRNPSYLYTNTILAGQNGVNDVLYQEDGQWKALRKWERDVFLDPTKFPNGVYSNYLGYKRFGINPQPLINGGYMNLNDGRFYVVKYDGRILQNNNGYTSADQTSLQQSSDGGLKLTVANVDSGFSETYTPSKDEVSAYFNGWKVKNADGTGKPTAWISIVDGKDAPTQTLAYVKDNKAPNYTPYKLTYQLATPRVEIVQVEGDLVADGLTPVTVNSGVVIREKITPNNDGLGKYRINNLFKGGASFKFSPSRIIGIYKNGIDDTRNWHMMYSNDFGHAVGNVWAQISANKFDPTAEYTVTYSVLDKHLFTTNATDVKVSYNQSIRSTVDELTVKQADTVTGLSILQNLMTDVLARLKANSL